MATMLVVNAEQVTILRSEWPDAAPLLDAYSSDAGPMAAIADIDNPNSVPYAPRRQEGRWW